MRLTFGDIPAGTSLFLDANTFVYAHSLHPQFGAASRDLLERIELQEICGVTSAHILAESTHRLMTLDACATFGWSFTGIARRMRRHATDVQTLSTYRQAIDEILASSVQVLAIDGSLIAAATSVSTQIGLLTNDALLVAIMQANGITNLASHDADFDRVPGITRYAPA